MSLMDLLRGGKHLSRGVHVPEFKEQTCHLPVRRLPFAPLLIVPLSQHAGAPAVPIVREGQEVVRGEPIAEPGGFVSVPMHAPATGRVERIAPAPSARGDLTQSIFIRPWPSASQEILYGAPQDIETMTPAEIIKAVQWTGVVGLGGAAFPTHVKMKVPEGRTIDTIVVNGCECEPYLTTDHRIMAEQASEVIHGTRIAMKALGAPRAIIGVEDNKPDAVEALRKALGTSTGPITVEAVATKYPQGAEKMLIQVLLGREVPSGGLPSEIGVAVFNVATLAQIGDLLPRRQGLIERVVTIAGPGVSKPGNYLTALGTPLRWALEQAGCRPDVSSVILGGPMMGPSIGSLDVPITKGVTGILVMTRSQTPDGHAIYPCIKCGACVEVCPLHLNPSRLGMLARKERYEEMEADFHLNDCFECGCCSYVCPSHIPLVQYFRVGKQMNRERKARENASRNV